MLVKGVPGDYQGFCSHVVTEFYTAPLLPNTITADWDIKEFLPLMEGWYSQQIHYILLADNLVIILNWADLN